MLRPSRVVLSMMLATVLLGACAETPQLAGNTFRTETGTPTGVNISYDFEYVTRTSYSVPQKLSAEAWLFKNTHHSYPGEFLEIHHVKEVQPYDTGPGDVVNLGRRQYKSQMFCLEWSGAGVAEMERGDEIAPYLALMHGNVDASRYIMIRRFMPQRRIEGVERIDMVFVEDLVRYGFDCTPFADMSAPAGEAAVDYINGFKVRSLRAFEIVS